MVQCNACLMIAVAFKGTSRECLCQGLGLESLKDKRWHLKIFFLLQNCQKICD